MEARPDYEQWRDISDFEGLYQISSHGRINSLINQKVMKPRLKKNGYLQIGLYKKGEYKTFTLHRLVAMAFIPNPDMLPYVNHKDENKQNNNVENLEWCTPSYNLHCGSALDKLSKATRNRPNYKKGIKKVFQYSLEGVFIAEYPSVNEASRQTGIKQGTISSNCLGTSKSTHGYVFRYE